MKILITGAGGRLGRLLYAARPGLADHQCQPVFQSRKPGFDLCWTATDGAERLPKCDAVVALWGVTAGSAEALAGNSTLVDMSRAVALECKAKTLFHISSAAVYGPGAAMSESSPTKPINAYGSAKLAMEQKVFQTPIDGLAEMCLRLANVVGADSLAPGLRSSDPITLDRFHDGQGPLRSYIGARDLLAVFCALAQLDGKTLPPAVNIAAPNAIAMHSLAKAAGKPIEWRPAPATATQEVTLDVSLMTRLLPRLTVMTKAEDLIADWRVLENVG